MGNELVQTNATMNSIHNEDGSVKHIRKEGARYHVLWWDSEGTHCTESDCEINRHSDATETILL